jgi:molecular chaperone DnaJ
MSKKDYYQILGVTKDSSQEEIKKAHKKLSKKYHPDFYPDEKEKEKAKDKFHDISEAYSVLSDPNKKTIYDQGGDPQQSGYGGHDSGFDFSGFSSSGFNMEDIFEGMFGGQKASQKSYDGSDLHFITTISLEEAFTGKKMTVKYSKQVKCATCSGTGAKDGKLYKCGYCSGKGYVESRSFIGVIRQTCPQCRGSKQSAMHTCGSCDGQKISKRNAEIEIKIPAGIYNEESLFLRGAGDEGLSGKNGDLILKIRIAEHAKFKRDKNDLYTSAKVPISKMVLGGECEIAGLMGESVKFNIKSGSQCNCSVKISGNGMPYGNSRGNLYVDITPEIPTNLTNEEKELWENMYKLENNDKPPKRGFWF